MTIGNRIRQARRSKGLTQEQLGKLCGMADSAVRRYESNKGNPTIATLNRIAEALGVSPQYLLSGSKRDSVSVYANGICVYQASSAEEIDAMISDRDPGSYKIVFQAPGIVITMDNDSCATQDQIDAIISICNNSASSASAVRAIELFSNIGGAAENIVAGMRLDKPYFALLTAFDQLNPEGQTKAVERVEELTEIPKYQKKPPQD